jgi:hypothetical protein
MEGDISGVSLQHRTGLDNLGFAFPDRTGFRGLFDGIRRLRDVVLDLLEELAGEEVRIVNPGQQLGGGLARARRLRGLEPLREVDVRRRRLQNLLQARVILPGFPTARPIDRQELVQRGPRAPAFLRGRPPPAQERSARLVLKLLNARPLRAIERRNPATQALHPLVDTRDVTGKVLEQLQ